MQNSLLHIRGADAKYVQRVDRSRFGRCSIQAEDFSSWSSLVLYCKQRGLTCVASTYHNLWNVALEGTREDNLGYVFQRDGIRCLYLPSLDRIYQEPHMKWLIDHWLCKLSNPECFVQADPFSYTKFHAADTDVWFNRLESPYAVLCAVDIETQREGLLITSCAFTVLMLDGKVLRSYSCAINLMDAATHRENMEAMRYLLRSKVPKLMHNGRYDNSYFLRFNAAPVAYLYDSYHMQHCMYPELPKTLAFCAQQYVLGIRYWKEMSSYNKLEYNARDTHATAWTWMGMMKHIKWQRADYALRNYKIEFPLVFPCIQVGLEGLIVDESKRLELRAKEVEKQQAALNKLRYVLRQPKFNPASPQQTLNLLHALGYKEAKKSDKKTMQHFAERGEIESYIVRLIQAYRNATKAIGTYYDVSLLNGQLMFSLDPAGTETGRMASKESNFWCGTQIQNIPAYAKPMIVAPEGWQFGSVDGSQAESRCTAYISGDEQLIYNVENSPDFHCTNCSLFFGIPFDELYSVQHKKVLRKDIRNVGKRVNHGANYNMGAFVLWETMGDKEVFRAAKLLDLPRYYTALQITATLLRCFNNTYPKIKGVWYAEVVDEVCTTGKLVGATGWTRRTFLNPRRSKPEINACVAHPPQSLSVMGVNKAFLAVWKRQISDWNGRFRIRMQVHDELVYMHRPNDDEISHEVAKIFMDCSRVRTKHGTMVIPCEPKFGAVNWGELKE